MLYTSVVFVLFLTGIILSLFVDQCRTVLIDDAETGNIIRPRTFIVASGFVLLAIIAFQSVGWLLTPHYYLYVFLIFSLLALSLIDYDSMYLPDLIVLPLMWVGILLASFNMLPISLHESVYGASGGYMILWIVSLLFKLLTGKDGMGGGDLKLLAALAAWMGVEQLPILILISSIAGLITGVIYLSVKKSTNGTGEQFPFGIALSIAGFISFGFGDYISALIY